MNVFRRVALVAVALFSVATLAGCSDPANPAENNHAKVCQLNGGSIHKYSQYGGKYSRSTYWCEDSQRNITDLWFENTDKGYRDV
jgi:hypothetical protein